MKRLLVALLMLGAAAPALAADVGVSISIGDPNFYGRIDIGDFPQPRVIYREPVVVERVVVEREPLYLRVPYEHAKNWRKHCRYYDACGRRVYFVQDRWYRDVYAPRYRERHGPPGHDRRPDHDRGPDRDRDRGPDRYDRGPDHDRGSDEGPGHGHGRGHDRGHGSDRDHGPDRDRDDD